VHGPLYVGIPRLRRRSARAAVRRCLRRQDRGLCQRPLRDRKPARAPMRSTETGRRDRLPIDIGLESLGVRRLWKICAVPGQLLGDRELRQRRLAIRVLRLL